MNELCGFGERRVFLWERGSKICGQVVHRIVLGGVQSIQFGVVGGVFVVRILELEFFGDIWGGESFWKYG